jgi:oligopeptide transport system permease protein
MVLCCVVGPFFLPSVLGEPGPSQYAPPSWEHPFGTDLNGRDLLYRVLTGGRISLLVGLCGAVVSLFIGTAWGLIAGYAGGRTDALMMRFVDILYSVPRLIFILIAINAFNAGLQEWANREGLAWLVESSRIAILILTLGFIEWLTMARIVRGQVLSLKERQFVTAARALGQSHVKILTRHLLPNLVGIILVYLTLTIPAVIIDESFLSFLGLGIQAPQASWGSLLADGAGAINPVRSFWWLLVFPAASMALTLLALNFLGDALRDAFDSKAR